MSQMIEKYLYHGTFIPTTEYQGKREREIRREGGMRERTGERNVRKGTEGEGGLKESKREKVRMGER